MERYELVLPPDSLATAFSGLIDPITKRIVANIHESHALAELRDSLLPKLISGELRVADAERFVGVTA